MRLLVEDRALGEGLDGNRLAIARRLVTAGEFTLGVGVWRQPSWPAESALWPGLLVLDGLLLRRLGIEGRYGGELLGSGDLLRPWQQHDPASTLPTRSAWAVTVRCRVAVLDRAFLERIATYPEITGALFARALARSRVLAASMAIVQQPKVERRVLLMLWQLADRWGTVRAHGVRLGIRVSHTTLAGLVAAQRPTVTAALSALRRSGAITLLPDRHLLLHAAPPSLDVSTDGNEMQTGAPEAARSRR